MNRSGGSSVSEEVLLTGCTGIVGRSIVRSLLDKGYFVTAYLLDIPSTDAFHQDFKEVRIVRGTLDEIDLHKAELGHPTAVFHLAWAGTTSTDRMDETLQEKNYHWSMKTLDVAVSLGAKTFLFSGSQAEYGRVGDTQEEIEDGPAEPFSAYGKEKKHFGEDGQAYSSLHGIRFVHGRIFSVYGPHDRPNSLISSLAEAERNGKKVMLGPCTHLWNFTHEDDIGELFVEALENGNAEGIINMVSPDTRPLKDFVVSSFGEKSYEFGTVNPNPEGLVCLRPSLTKVKRLFPLHRFRRFEEEIAKMKKEKIQ